MRRKFEMEAKPSTIGMVLLHHGIFSFGATAEESYGRMIALVDRAENYLKQKGAWELPAIGPMGPIGRIGPILASLRKSISETASFPVIAGHGLQRQSARLRSRRQACAMSPNKDRPRPITSCARNACRCWAGTFRRMRKAIANIFRAMPPRAKESKTMLDPAPRVILDDEFGLGCVGRSAKEAAIAARSLFPYDRCDLESGNAGWVSRALRGGAV